MAFYPEIKGIPLDAYNKMVQKMVRQAENDLNLRYGEGLILRDLRPEDIGTEVSGRGAEWSYTANTATDWNTIVDATTIDDNRYVGISGVWHSESVGDVSQLRITREGSVSRVWDLLPIIQFKHQIGYVDDPITIRPNTSLTIEAWARTASTTDGFGFIGAVVEKRGLLVNP